MQKLKYLTITFVNYALVLCACLFYKDGAPLVWSIYITVQILLTVLNYIFSSKKSELIFYSVNLVISTILANALSTYLYYCNISSDLETLAVGELGLIVGVIFVVIMSLVSVLFKKKKSEWTQKHHWKLCRFQWCFEFQMIIACNDK